LVPKPAGALNAGINVEVWHNFIVDNLFRNNAFLENSIDVSDYVLNGAVVHIPNAGQPSNVVRNRQNLPAKVTRRKDIDVVYALDEFTTDPVAILRADEMELSYNKMENVMAADMAKLRQEVAQWMLYNWRFEGSGNIIPTTGSNVATHLAGANGNRKALKLDNLAEAQARMDEQDLPEEERYAMFDARMYQQLIAGLSSGDYKDFSRYYDAAKGVVGELFGFKIMKRSYVLRTDNSNVVKLPDATVATTDQAAVLCWQKTAVERALGSVEAFERQKDPTFYGDIYSFLLRAGGRKRRADNLGVIGIVQANA
jgi:hypothetical protein